MILFETPRLIVRHLEVDDLEALFSVFCNPDVTRWMGDGKPLTLEDCEKWITISQRNYVTRGYGASAVLEKSTNEFIGLSGIVYDAERGEPEIIYAFDPRGWGKGYASELVPAMLAYGLNHCGLSYVLATIAPENLASRRIVEKSGMIFVGEETDSDGIPALVYRIEKNNQ